MSRMKNLPSLYLRVHDGFCKRCCPRADIKVSPLRLQEAGAETGRGSQEGAKVLRS